MRDQAAYFISLLFHPLLMPSYLFLYIILFASSLMQPLKMDSLFQLLGIIFIVTFIIPVISISTLRFTNLISDFHLNDRNQRIIPFLFITCFYGITAYMFYSKLTVNNLVVTVFITITGLIFILTAITFFWKISVHGAASGGIIGIITVLGMQHPVQYFGVILAVVTLMGGLIFYSRLKLNAHTPAQVYAGALLGFTLCFTSIYLFFSYP